VKAVSPNALGIEPAVTVRAGLGEPGRRLERSPCVVAYLGASVTVQKQGYRPRLHELLVRRSGQQHKSIMAAVGATGVVPGAFLSDGLVASHRPDICLIEYSTPLLGGREARYVGAALDGIVSKLLAIGAQPCLLHLYRRGKGQDELVASFEEVAEAHGIPSIDLMTPLREAVTAGELAKEALFKDGIHTTPEGSQMVAELAGAALATIVESDGPGATLTAAAPIPSYRDAREVPASIDDVHGDADAGLFKLHLPYVSVGPGAELRRRFDCTLHGLALIIGPESGEVEVVAEGAAQRKMAFDASSNYERFAAMMLSRPVPAGIEATIRVTDTVPDYSITHRPMEPPASRRLKLFSYLVTPV
jgi:hypothetical protein